MSSGFCPVLSESEGLPTLAGNICNILGSSCVYYDRRDSAKEGRVPKDSKSELIFRPISAVGTTSCLLIARAPLRGCHTSRENPL